LGIPSGVREKNISIALPRRTQRNRLVGEISRRKREDNPLSLLEKQKRMKKKTASQKNGKPDRKGNPSQEKTTAKQRTGLRRHARRGGKKNRTGGRRRRIRTSSMDIKRKERGKAKRVKNMTALEEG